MNNIFLGSKAKHLYVMLQKLGFPVMYTRSEGTPNGGEVREYVYLDVFDSSPKFVFIDDECILAEACEQFTQRTTNHAK